MRDRARRPAGDQLMRPSVPLPPTQAHRPARLTGVLAAAMLAAVSACSDNAAPQSATPAVPVLTATVARKTVPVQIQAIGSVEAYATVAVKARVDGQITRVFFKEGQDVRPGDTLFEIDPRPFAAQLKQAQANLMRDRAQLDNARVQERRYQDLIQKKLVAKDQYDQVRTNRETAEANVRADEAAIENARLQLEYSTIRSPIAGRTGRIMIQQGNLVKANDSNPLVVINQVDPIYVSFSVPEQRLGAIRRYMNAGSVRVRATLPDADTPAVSGRLEFVDNAVDTTTGTIRLKAAFRNEERVLWPGQFVNAVLTLYEQTDAVVVPAQAVQTGPTGQYVFVVKPDLTAEVRPVIPDRTVGGETVIAQGVVPGERVVTTGQSRLVPGSKVSIKTG
jgi:membrane fusion protein, multidrug efflux system